MIKLNETGYTYGCSRNEYVLWVYKDEKLTHYFTDFSRVKDQYFTVSSATSDVPSNTYDCEDARIITEEEFVVILNRMLVNVKNLTGVMTKLKARLCPKKVTKKK